MGSLERVTGPEDPLIRFYDYYKSLLPKSNITKISCEYVTIINR